MPTWTQERASAMTGGSGQALSSFDAQFTSHRSGAYVFANHTLFGGSNYTDCPIYSVLCTSNDHQAEIVSVNPTGSFGAGVFVRGSYGSNFSGYVVLAKTGTVTLEKVTANSAVSLGTWSGSFATNDVLTLEAFGSSIKAYRNGVQIIAATDSAFATGKPGVIGNGNQTGKLFKSYVAAVTALLPDTPYTMLC